MDNHLRPLLISYIDLNYKEEKLKGSINSSIRKSKEVKNLLALVSQYRWAITMESSNKDFEQFKILRSLNNMRRIINQELDDN
jgi:alkyl hydroperoxide reductase subunit AhpF